MAQGFVKFFNTEKGWGFVTPDGGGLDIFVHIKDIRPLGTTTLPEGARVVFETAPGKDGKGPKAVNLTLA
jgi:CspA family cold shock protein